MLASRAIRQKNKPSIAVQFKNNLKSIFRNRKIATLVVSLSVLTIGNESIDFLLQYVSKRYDWSIAKVGTRPPKAYKLGLLLKIQFND